MNRESSPGVPNATGLPEFVTNGTVTVTPEFNGYGELESLEYQIGVNTIFTWSTERNDAGLITAKSETTAGISHTSGYEYDALGRLATVTYDGAGTEDYLYDANGNRTYDRSERFGNAGRTYEPADNEDHILQVGPLLYNYDADGFLDTKANTGTIVADYTYNLGGELTSVALDDKVIEYTYDPAGRRIAKSVDGVITEKYQWAGQTTLLAVYNSDDTLRQRFVYAGGRLPIAMEQSGSTYYLAYDQVGSLRVVFDQTGAIIKAVEYDTYGNIVADTNQSFHIPVGFAGGLYDPDTGLTRFGYRDYDPELGRWTAKDPIGFMGGSSNLYVYAFNDPINILDPDGLDFLYAASNFSAGLGDHISFGLTRRYRQWAWGHDVVNPCSGWYAAGDYAGYGYDLIGAGSAVKAGIGILGRRAGARTAAAAVARGGMAPIQAGRVGEAGSGVIGNTSRIYSPLFTTKYRVPDGLTKTVLSEVKNVKKLSYTRQLREYAAYANQNGLRFQLHIPPTTQVTGPLQQAINAGDIIRVDLLVP